MWQLEAESGEGEAELDGMRWTGKRSDAAIELSTAWGVAISVVSVVVAAALDCRLEKLLMFSIRVRIQFDFHRARTKKLPTFWKFAANSAESQSDREKKKQPQWPSKCWFICPSHGCHTLLDPSRKVSFVLFFFGFWLAAKIFEIFCFRLAKFAAANGVLQRSGMQASEIHQRIIKFAVTYGVFWSVPDCQRNVQWLPKRNNAYLPNKPPNWLPGDRNPIKHQHDQNYNN